MTQPSSITFIPATPQSVSYAVVRSRSGADYASINLASCGVTVAFPLDWFYELAGGIRVLEQDRIIGERVELKGSGTLLPDPLMNGISE